MMKLIKYMAVFFAILLLSGCQGSRPNFSAMSDTERDAYNAREEGISLEQYVKNRNDQIRINKKRMEEASIELDRRLSSYEDNYFAEFETIKRDIPDRQSYYFQPKNKKEPCKVYMAYDSQKDESSKLFWDGQCKNGYAHGMGRLIQKADLIDRWQLGIYKQGKTNGYCILNDILHDSLREGECKYTNENDNYVIRQVFNDNQNINIIYRSGSFGHGKIPSSYIETSPFWNKSVVYRRQYPNFNYEFIDNLNNSIAEVDFGFSLHNKNNIRHGWGYEKNRGRDLVKGEYINGKGQRSDLPQLYMDKADNIINEIKQSYNQALQAQSQAQLIKKQYKKHICKSNIKVDFMDNAEYKEICSDDKEMLIVRKTNEKLNKMAEERIAQLEKQRFNAQQQSEAQHRQQLLSLERQRLNEQRRHNQEQEADTDAAHFQQGIKNLTDQINNMTPKTYNVNMYHY